MPIKTLAQIEILINESKLGHTNLHQQHQISAKPSPNHLSKQHRHAIYAKKATEEHSQHYYHDQDKQNSTDFAPCLFCSHRKSLFRTISPSSGHTKHHKENDDPNYLTKSFCASILSTNHLHCSSILVQCTKVATVTTPHHQQTLIQKHRHQLLEPLQPIQQLTKAMSV